MPISSRWRRGLAVFILAGLAAAPADVLGQRGQGADANATRASFCFTMARSAPDNGPQADPIFEVGGDVTPPSLLATTDAWYPNAARDAGIGGVVVIEGVVRGDGSLGNLKVTESVDTRYGLDDRALEAVRQWAFVPGKWHGQPVSVAMMFAVEFGPRLSGAPLQIAAEFEKGPHPGEPKVASPTVLRRVQALYLPAALRARVAGDVRIQTVVGEDGRVSDARVTRRLDSTFGLDEVALQAARRWTFTPATIGGHPVPMVVDIVEEFRIH